MNSGNSILVPKNMEPGIEDWRKLGFKFDYLVGEMPEALMEGMSKEETYLLKLPEGWHEENLNIIDNNGRLRGTINYIEKKMELYCFYKVFQKMKSERLKVCFGTNNPERSDSELFLAGEVVISQSSDEEERAQIRAKIEGLVATAKKWADEAYPDWRNPLAYWDEDLVKKPTSSM